MCSFAQAWTVYTALCCTSTNDPHLGMSLSSFLVHIIKLDSQYYWATVAEYILTICQWWFGHTSAYNWVEQDINMWQKDIGSIPCYTYTSKLSTGKVSGIARLTSEIEENGARDLHLSNSRGH
ncbi:hypothetical protein [Sporisorium scitamineum]|uniref:Uncharacterized protein n=1 Tax=Sporisorium scitamineum TaxID=49012 RepID=A0A0F7RTV8_9BASI|nr:hypothetical protein [Sporisorium scitamineum]